MYINVGAFSQLQFLCSSVDVTLCNFHLCCFRMNSSPSSGSVSPFSLPQDKCQQTHQFSNNVSLNEHVTVIMGASVLSHGRNGVFRGVVTLLSVTCEKTIHSLFSLKLLSIYSEGKTIFSFA